MAWNIPADWDYKETPGSAKLNQQIRDNMNYLKLLVPAGVIMDYAGATAPDQWLLCNGAAVSRSTYSALFTAIGTTFGNGDGTTTFNLPDKRGRVAIGAGTGSGLTKRSLAETVGTETHLLAANEMPVHTHIQNAHTHIQNQHRHTMEMDYSDSNGPYTQGSAGTANGPINTNYTTPTNQNTTATNQNTGGGAVHNNMQPSLVLNSIIKY